MNQFIKITANVNIVTTLNEQALACRCTQYVTPCTKLVKCDQQNINIYE